MSVLAQARVFKALDTGNTELNMSFKLYFRVLIHSCRSPRVALGQVSYGAPALLAFRRSQREMSAIWTTGAIFISWNQKKEEQYLYRWVSGSCY